MYKFVKDRQWWRREREKCGGREGRGRSVVGEKGEGEERREINTQYPTNFSQRGLPKCMQNISLYGKFATLSVRCVLLMVLLTVDTVHTQ